MLVLSRKVNEKVLLPELGITIEVVRIKGNQVRVGISAPDDIRILRGELKPVVDEFCPTPSPLPLVNTGIHPVTKAVA